MGDWDGLNRHYRIERDIYSGRLKLNGEEHEEPSQQPTTTRTPFVYLRRRGEEAKTLLRKMIPVARRVLGERNELTLRRGGITRSGSICKDTAATLDNRLRDAVTTLEDLTEQIARRVLGGAHPLVGDDPSTFQPARSARRAERPRVARDHQLVGAKKYEDALTVGAPRLVASANTRHANHE